jgi:hypothetical protein
MAGADDRLALATVGVPITYHLPTWLEAFIPSPSTTQPGSSGIAVLPEVVPMNA